MILRNVSPGNQGYWLSLASYQYSQNCSWLITPRNNSILVLDFIAFSTDPRDKLQVRGDCH